jgi:undecaprenyl-diphosphatase
MNLLHAIFLGFIEGATEFLPVSSTGHLVLFNYFSQIDLALPAVQTFEISIQLGAIMAVVVFYFRDFTKIKTLKKLAIGVLPTLVIAFLLKDYVEKFLTWPKLIAYNLLIGGFIIIIAEIVYRKRKYIANTKECIDYKQSFLLGVFQSISVMPGVSRSGIVIVSGLFMGLKREELAKYSFLLAVPTMFAATSYSVFKNREIILNSNSDLSIIFAGFVTSFIIALFAVKIFLPIVKKYSFIPFGIYRILLGGALLLFVL